LEPVAEFLLTAIGSATLPHLAGSRGTVVVSLEGVALPEWTYDLSTGRATPGAGQAAQARVRAPAHAFIMAAAGREAFDGLRARGVVTVEGDEAPAAALLGKLRIV